EFITNVFQGISIRTADEAIEEASRRVQQDPRSVGGDRVPDAPFKKTWQELALKRMLRFAAENGYAKLAWTTGAQQTRRYEDATRQQVDEIRVRPVPEGEGFEYSGLKAGLPVISAPVADEQALADAIGKEMAQRALGQLEGGAKEAVLKGDDLTIGGEGMKGFYDKMLPQYLNKYGKKWGARVGRTEIGQQIWDVVDTSTGRVIDSGAGTQSTAESAASIAGPQYEARSRPDQLVPSIDITPKMRESVLQGQPLFQAKQPPPPEGEEPSKPEEAPLDVDALMDEIFADYVDQTFHPKPPAEAATEAPSGPPLKKGEKERSFPQSLEAQGRLKGDNLTYVPITNDETEAESKRRLAVDGVDALQAEVLREDAGSDNAIVSNSLAVIAKRQFEHERLMQEAAEATDPKERDRLVAEADEHNDAGMKVASTISARLTDAGRIVQNAKLISRLSPEAVSVWAAHTIDKINEKRTPREKLQDPQGRVLTLQESERLTALAKEAGKWEDLKITTVNMSEIITRIADNISLHPGDLQKLKDFSMSIRNVLGEEEPVVQPTEGKKKKKKTQADRVRDFVVSKAAGIEERALARLKAKGMVLHTLPVDMLADVVSVGFARLAKGSVKYADWTESMLGTFGDQIKPHLRAVYGQSQKRLSAETARARKVIAQAKAISDLIIKIETSPDVAERPDAEELLRAVRRLKDMTGEVQKEYAAEISMTLQALEESTIMEKLRAGVFLSDLLNPKTIVTRNMLSNEIFWRFHRLRMYGASAIDWSRSSLVGVGRYLKNPKEGWQPSDRYVTWRTGGAGFQWTRGIKQAIQRNFKEEFGDSFVSDLIHSMRLGWSNINPEALGTRYDHKGGTFQRHGFIVKKIEKLLDTKVKVPTNPFMLLEKTLGATLRGGDRAAYKRAVKYRLGEMAILQAMNNKIPKKDWPEYVEKFLNNVDDAQQADAHAEGEYATFQNKNLLTEKAQQAGVSISAFIRMLFRNYTVGIREDD
ncbi:hypothetical protein LCGC14_1631340, partial [marine sediment metagenome]